MNARPMTPWALALMLTAACADAHPATTTPPDHGPEPRDVGLDIPDDSVVGDSGRDLGFWPPESSGEPCTPERGCRSPTATCLIDEHVAGRTLGGEGDPILDHPDGESSVVTRTVFPDGYCSPSGVDNEPGCDPAASESTCLDPHRCVDMLGGICVHHCDPAAPGNDDCRPGYQCHPTERICIGGCQSDDECRVARRETNGLPELQSPDECLADPALCLPSDCDAPSPSDPDACAAPAGNFDRLVYDTASRAVCDPDSHRCR